MIFKTFPADPDLYSQDMQKMVSETIERFGIDEWRAGVLTNELHGHLGVYAILGVKMGLFALDTLGVEAGEVCITSLAGMRPPVSCLNDGLQVSTSATFGHGLITSENAEDPRPEAFFRVKDKYIYVKIKEPVLEMIRNEITRAVQQWGHAPEYWNYVRKLAIRYWAELNRNEIFEVKTL